MATETPAAAADAPTAAAAAEAAAAVAAAEQAAASAAAEPKPAAPAAPVVPDTYDLKLPDGATVDPAIVERTAAIARELGLTNENGQKALEKIVEEVGTASKASADAAVEAYKKTQVDAITEGTDAWKANQELLRAAALDLPDVKGDSAKLDALVLKGKQVLDRFATPEDIKFLHTTGLGSSPRVVALLGKIGAAMGEGGFVAGAQDTSKPKTTREERMYGVDGRGPSNKQQT